MLEEAKEDKRQEKIKRARARLEAERAAEEASRAKAKWRSTLLHNF